MVVMRNHTTDSHGPSVTTPMPATTPANGSTATCACPCGSWFEPALPRQPSSRRKSSHCAWNREGVQISSSSTAGDHLQQSGVPCVSDGDGACLSGMNWTPGRDNLLIVSVGTGNAPRARPDQSAGDLWLLENAKSIPAALMNAASAGWDMACRIVGDCRYGAPIDREFGQRCRSSRTIRFRRPFRLNLPMSDTTLT